MFAAQPRQVGKRLADAFAFEQLGHQSEHRRLRTAQVIAAVAVGDVPEGVDQVGEVVGHVAQQVAPSAGSKAEHAEVGIPVVHLAEPTARHHVGIGQRQQRGPRRMLARLAGQYAPQVVDVFGQRSVRVGHVFAFVGILGLEVRMHECGEVEGGLAVHGAVFLEDPLRVGQRRAIDEGLAVGEHAAGLHRDEQLLVTVGRGQGVGRGNPRDLGLVAFAVRVGRRGDPVGNSRADLVGALSHRRRFRRCGCVVRCSPTSARHRRRWCCR